VGLRRKKTKLFRSQPSNEKESGYNRWSVRRRRHRFLCVILERTIELAITDPADQQRHTSPGCTSSIDRRRVGATPRALLLVGAACRGHGLDLPEGSCRATPHATGPFEGPDDMMEDTRSKRYDGLGWTPDREQGIVTVRPSGRAPVVARQVRSHEACGENPLWTPD